MTEEWVSLVWEKGKEENVHATDSQFSKHKCPALMGITFTVSQVPSVLLICLYNLCDLTSLPAQDVALTNFATCLLKNFSIVYVIKITQLIPDEQERQGANQEVYRVSRGYVHWRSWHGEHWDPDHLQAGGWQVQVRQEVEDPLSHHRLRLRLHRERLLPSRRRLQGRCR